MLTLLRNFRTFGVKKAWQRGSKFFYKSETYIQSLTSVNKVHYAPSFIHSMVKCNSKHINTIKSKQNLIKIPRKSISPITLYMMTIIIILKTILKQIDFFKIFHQILSVSPSRQHFKSASVPMCIPIPLQRRKDFS